MFANLKKYSIMHLINNILTVLMSELSAPKLKVLSQICKGILSSSNKITMLEISRYTQSVYRTIQRFFSKQDIYWQKLNMKLFKHFVYRKDKVFLLASDEVVEKKSGKSTFGISHFFSNIEKQTIPSVAFMNLSMVDIAERKSYSIATKQVVKPEKKNKPKPNKPQPKSSQTTENQRKKGRPKGSKNKEKTTTTDIQYRILNELLEVFKALSTTYLQALSATYLTLDGYFGNQYYIRLAKSFSLHLISKLKRNSTLFFPYEGTSKGRGRPRKYGTRVNVKNPPLKYHKGTETEGKFIYDFYQMQLWNKSYTDAMLNTVIIISKNTQTGRTANCILFSTDLNLAYDKIVEYYGLRFQIEFNFRDAKQYFGLADFKNYKEVQLTNAVNLAFFMCNLSYILIKDFKEQFNLEVVSIIDLKTYYRTEFIANKTLNLKKKGKKAIHCLNPNEIFNIAKNLAVNF